MGEIIITRDHAPAVEEDWGSLTWYTSAEMGNSEDLTVGKCVLKPGCRNPGHHHPNCSEVLTVMKGRIRHTGPGGEMIEMGVGDTVTIPVGVAHYAVNIGDEDAELFICFSSADRRVVGE
jgi:quercetin dioxygenase-like cupin family protein